MCSRLQPHPGHSPGSFVRGRRHGQGQCADFSSTRVQYASLGVPVTPCIWLKGHLLEKEGKLMTADEVKLTSGERKILVG